MNAIPVIVREVRAEARGGFIYYLRVLAVAGATAALGVALWDQTLPPAVLGARLFTVLASVLLGLVWVTVPLLTADCISRERREGTLGFLFLTPLSAMGIVWGKCIVAVGRSLTVFGAVVPVLALPFLLGGVTWVELAILVGQAAAAMLLALGAGLVASAFTRDWLRAVLLAEAIAALGILLFLYLHMGLVRSGELVAGWAHGYLGGRSDLWLALFWQRGMDPASWLGASLAAVPGLMWHEPPRFFWRQGVGPVPVQHIKNCWYSLVACLPALGLILFLLAVRIAARQVERSWREEPMPRWQRWLVAVFCAPRFWKGWLSSRLSKQLDRNPIGWLQEYSWSSRLTKWGWCFVVVVVECLLISDASLRSLLPGQAWMAGVVLLSLCLSAATSFRRERETGAMELLLVTPLSVTQIIAGRVRGLLRLFAPAVGLLMLVWVHIGLELSRWFERQRVELPLEVPILLMGGFLTIPFVGLWCSLFRWGVVRAWGVTVLAGCVLPWLAGLLSRETSGGGFLPVMVATQVVVGIGAGLRLRHQLASREFILHAP